MKHRYNVFLRNSIALKIVLYTFFDIVFSFYIIIVNPKIDLSYDPKPSEMTSYDKEYPNKAYISGILSSYQPSFVVG